MLSSAIPGLKPQLQALSLRNNFSWTLLGSVVYAACQWLIVVVLAKLGTPEMVGQLALALAITAPVFTFVSLNLRTVQATDARRDYSFHDYMHLRLSALVIGLAVIGGILLAFGYSTHLGCVILVVGIAKALESVSDIVYGLLQQHERMDRIAISQMIKGPLHIIAVTIAAYATGNLLWCVLGQASANAVVLGLYDRRSAIRALDGQLGPQVHSTRRRITRPWSRSAGRDFSSILNLALLSLPLGIVAGLDSLNLSIPRYFVEHSMGPRELGLFSAMAYLMFPGGMVAAAFFQSASARLARFYVEDLRRFTKLLLSLALFAAANGVVGVVAALLLGRQLLAVVYRPEYGQNPAVLACLMAAAGMGYVASALMVGLYAARCFQVQLVVCGLEVLATMLSCMLLVPRYGLIGAACAVLIGMTTWCGGCCVAVLHTIWAASAGHPPATPSHDISSSEGVLAE